MEKYCIERNALTPEIYENLRAKVSLQYYGREDVEEALAHTLFSVVIREGQVLENLLGAGGNSAPLQIRIFVL